MRAHSSNFIRTQLTAQYFLHGLFRGVDAVDSSVIKRWSPPTIQATLQSEDYIAPPEIGALAEAMKRAYAHHSYSVKEDALTSVAQLFAEHVPFFNAHVHGGADGVGTKEAFQKGRTPLRTSRFLWIRADDMFVTHGAHDAPIPSPHILSDHKELVRSHLLWRYRQLFASPDVLPLLAGPLFRHILKPMTDIAGGSSAPRSRASISPESMALYSGHDVTILPAIFVLLSRSCDLSIDGSSAILSPSQAESMRVATPWPSYASVLRFELHEPCEGSPWKVTWEWRNDAVSVGEEEATAAQVSSTTPSHKTPFASLAGAFSLADFTRLVADLNSSRFLIPADWAATSNARGDLA